MGGLLSGAMKIVCAFLPLLVCPSHSRLHARKVAVVIQNYCLSRNVGSLARCVTEIHVYCLFCYTRMLVTERSHCSRVKTTMMIQKARILMMRYGRIESPGHSLFFTHLYDRKSSLSSGRNCHNEKLSGKGKHI